MPSKQLEAQPADSAPSASRAIINGEEKYTRIASVPILALFALPHQRQSTSGGDSTNRAFWQARSDSVTAAHATAFENGVPSAHVVRIPNATHFVFRSNEADVMREMHAFLERLPQ
jgi:non-heme chloroperoxidase